MEKVYGYARVSTREQNLDRQIAALRQYIADERDIITDKESGKDFNRRDTSICVRCCCGRVTRSSSRVLIGSGATSSRSNKNWNITRRWVCA